MASGKHNRHAQAIAIAAGAAAAACRIGGGHPSPPVDSGAGGADASDPDAADPTTPDSNMFHGMHAMIGDRPEGTGSCGNLDDWAEMTGRFDPPMQEQDVRAGWEFDTTADDYGDPAYGFDPAWPSSASGRFSVRYRARLELAPGTHCFSIDIGATGTDIIGGKNACGQLWIGGGIPSAPLAETGFEAASSGVATGCVDVTGPADLDVVFWYFNIFERAKLAVRHCMGAGCTPDQPLSATALAPR